MYNTDINLNKEMHIDDFIDGGYFNQSESEKYARWCFLLFRLPALLQHDFKEYTKQYKLFCTYKDQKYRVTGASRLGDIFLSKDFNREYGYDKRVLYTDCLDWSKD